jgi:hypothetical protein
VHAFVPTQQFLIFQRMCIYKNIITLEPGKRSGRPCIRGMRITVEDILRWLASEMTFEPNGLRSPSSINALVYILFNFGKRWIKATFLSLPTIQKGFHLLYMNTLRFFSIIDLLSRSTPPPQSTSYASTHASPLRRIRTQARFVSSLRTVLRWRAGSSH